ncbi:MAG: HAD-IC family P-type ATPase [Thermomicrobiales bacterium]
MTAAAPDLNQLADSSPPVPGTADAPVALTSPDTGLSAAEATRRREAGQGNDVVVATGTTYKEILKRNLLTFINVTLVGIGFVLVALGEVQNAILASGLAVLTAIVGVIQEVQAKRRLDKIALLNRTKTTVIRDGQEQRIDPEQLVLGDVILLKPGSQVPLDGQVLVADALSMDESLLTGEADHVEKKRGEPLYSGSYCVAGSGRYAVEQVGADSLASSITAGARSRKATLTPLQQQVNAIVKVLIFVAASLLIALMVQAVVFWHASFRDSVTAAAVILGIVPPGLFFMITITYTLAAVRLAGRDALVQQTNAIESLSNVDVFCMDKTGTLTTNNLQLETIDVMGDRPATDVQAWLGTFAVSVDGGTKTSDALANAYPQQAITPAAIVPFASARRWSGMVADAGATKGTFVLGAPEMLAPNLATPPRDQDASWKEHGLRVLLFAWSPDSPALTDADGAAALPDGLQPVCWIVLRDELRPHLRETLTAFEDVGVTLKIISGDNPETVRALAVQAGFPAESTHIAGDDLDPLQGAAFDDKVESTTVFGRIGPHLKERIVDSLQANGHYVAMTGDGVNDVLSLKKAQLGIAMESGSEATRGVADIVLLHDSFSALPVAFQEGQRIRQGLKGTLAIFLSRVFTVAIIIGLTAYFRFAFPFLPGHMSVLTALTVGIPTMAIALFAPSHGASGSPAKWLVKFVVPAVLFGSVAAFLMYAFVYVQHDLTLSALTNPAELVSAFLFNNDEVLGRDTLTLVLVLFGLGLVVFVSPPTEWLAVAEENSHDWRPTIVAALMVPLYVIILVFPGLREFFGLNVLVWWLYPLIVAEVAIFMVALRYLWASRILDRVIETRAYDRFARVVVRVAREIDRAFQVIGRGLGAALADIWRRLMAWIRGRWDARRAAAQGAVKS